MFVCFVGLFVSSFVCLSALVSHKPHVHVSANFLCVLPVAVARSSSDDNAIRYVLPVLWMTCGFTCAF